MARETGSVIVMFSKSVSRTSYKCLWCIAIIVAVSACEQPTDSQSAEKPEKEPAEEQPEEPEKPDPEPEPEPEPDKPEPKPAPNTPPAVELIAPEAVANGEPITCEADATDADGDALTYEWSVDGEAIGAEATATFTRSPDVEIDYTVTAMVSDGTDTTEKSATVTVAAPLWKPKALYVYTFPATLTREELSGEAIREQWKFTESNYHDMLSRVEATVDTHNRDNPDDQLQVIEGGT